MKTALTVLAVTCLFLTSTSISTAQVYNPHVAPAYQQNIGYSAGGYSTLGFPRVGFPTTQATVTYNTAQYGYQTQANLNQVGYQGYQQGSMAIQRGRCFPQMRRGSDPATRIARRIARKILASTRGSHHGHSGSSGRNHRHFRTNPRNGGQDRGRGFHGGGRNKDRGRDAHRSPRFDQNQQSTIVDGYAPSAQIQRQAGLW